MIQQAFTISVTILAIYYLTLEGNIGHYIKAWIATRIDKAFGRVLSRYIQKPLWDCLPCMSSFWTIVLTLDIDLPLILLVCGFNVLIENLTTITVHE